MRDAHQADAQRAGRQAEGRRRAGSDFGFITQQSGMFSYSGLNATQMERLRSEFGIYGVDTGRICVAALNSRNIDAVVSAIAKVSDGLNPATAICRCRQATTAPAANVVNAPAVRAFTRWFSHIGHTRCCCTAPRRPQCRADSPMGWLALRPYNSSHCERPSECCTSSMKPNAPC